MFRLSKYMLKPAKNKKSEIWACILLWHVVISNGRHEKCGMRQ